MLEAKNLSCKIGKKNILKNISFKISEGEFVGLLGPNGSGKTTVIRILSGVLNDYDGVATLNLMHMRSLSRQGIARQIAVVPQEANFAFPFSSLEIVLMGRQAYQKGLGFDSDVDLRIAENAMMLTDCLKFADRCIDTLSGGEKQRVLLARALAQKPKILLLDEPASHLDLAHQQNLFKLLVELNRKEGLTILCVAHDLNIASLYCRRLFFLKDGELKINGEAKEVMNEENIRAVFDVACKKTTDSDGRSYYVPG